MRYMMMIYSQETPEGPPPEEIPGIIARHSSLMDDAAARGVLVAVEGLKTTALATTVRVENGKSLITDGPFAETKEQLAGYYIIDCQNLDEAIEWAKRIPTGCKGGSGCIEIRPVADLPYRP